MANVWAMTLITIDPTVFCFFGFVSMRFSNMSLLASQDACRESGFPGRKSYVRSLTAEWNPD
jgi:hypothetical protein